MERTLVSVSNRVNMIDHQNVDRHVGNLHKLQPELSFERAKYVRQPRDFWFYRGPLCVGKWLARQQFPTPELKRDWVPEARPRQLIDRFESIQQMIAKPDQIA